MIKPSPDGEISDAGDFKIQAVEHSLSSSLNKITRKHTMATMGVPLPLSITHQDSNAFTIPL